MSDDVMQDLDRMVRVGLTTAAQLGEHLRRRAAEADRQRRDAAVDQQHAMVERLRAIRDEARAHYAKIGWADWQDQATLAAWAEAYQVTHQMRPFDPVAASAHDRIEVEVRRRFNVDIREALQLHLQQIAEDQRIRAERDRDTGPREQQPSAGASPAPPPAAAETIPPAVDEPVNTSDPVVDEPGPGLSPQDPHTIQGEVVTDVEVAGARTAARTAAQGFDQTAGAAVRQHRSGSLSRRRPARRRRADETATRRRGR